MLAEDVADKFVGGIVARFINQSRKTSVDIFRSSMSFDFGYGDGFWGFGHNDLGQYIPEIPILRKSNGA